MRPTSLYKRPSRYDADTAPFKWLYLYPETFNYILSYKLELLFRVDIAFPDMLRGTDCPYPKRILAFFEMIRPYHVGIRI